MPHILRALLLFVVAPGLAFAEPAPTPSEPRREKASKPYRPEHPYGETPLERIVVLAHTDSLPECDKVVVYTFLLSTKGGRKIAWKDRVLTEKTLGPAESKAVCDNWRRLSFNMGASAFCHHPPYGLRFYRNNRLLYDTTVCWECSNFFVPDLSRDDPNEDEEYEDEDDEEGDDEEDASPIDLLSRRRLYGFEKDAASAELLDLVKRLLPHPELDQAASTEAANE